MKLYLNGKKYKININGTTCRLNLSSDKPNKTGTRLLSADGYVLKDSNGVYLNPKEGD